MNISARTTLSLALGGFLLLGAVPAIAQGVYQSPPSPNASESMPEPPDSAPLSARTLPPGSTGEQQVGTIVTTRVEPTLAAPFVRPAPGVVLQR